MPAARAALISYPYSSSVNFPQLEAGGRCAMGGPVYYFNESLDSNRKLSKAYDSSVFFYDWVRGWIMAGKLGDDEKLLSLQRFMPGTEFIRPMDLELGPDGALYLIEWGSNYGGSNDDAKIVRLQPGVELHNENSSGEELGGEASLLEKFSNSLAGGNASRGQDFYQSPKAGCTCCHKIGDHGGLIGPDLSLIGQQLSRQELLEAIILPSKKIAPQYQFLIVQMKSGERYAGIAQQENSDELLLTSPEMEPIMLQKSDIKSVVRGASPMPAGMGSAMTEGEMRDLIEFMSQLESKEVQAAKADHR